MDQQERRRDEQSGCLATGGGDVFVSLRAVHSDV
jgi:hypothetical protein